MRKGSLVFSTVMPPSMYPHNSKWIQKTWNGLSNFLGSRCWSDGVNIYYSSLDEQYVLNGDTWEGKDWGEKSIPNGSNVWTDGTNVYYSQKDAQYVLNGDTWVDKQWNGYAPELGSRVWTDGTNIYYSYNDAQYVLSGDTWVEKTWGGDTHALDGQYIWSDGTNIYCFHSLGVDARKVLVGNTWEDVEAEFPWYGNTIWSDGTSVYESYLGSGTNRQYVLNGDTWVEKEWIGIDGFYAVNLWSDGTNIYYSNNDAQYVLERTIPETTDTLHNASFLQGYIVGRRLAGMRK